MGLQLTSSTNGPTTRSTKRTLAHSLPRHLLKVTQKTTHHPPVSVGEHPGLGWELNAPGTVMYYRFLIPDPTTNRCRGRPLPLLISFPARMPKSIRHLWQGLSHSHPPPSALPLDYFVPSATPEQIGLLDAQSPCANAINKVLNTYFPYRISLPPSASTSISKKPSTPSGAPSSTFKIRSNATWKRQWGYCLNSRTLTSWVDSWHMAMSLSRTSKARTPAVVQSISPALATLKATSHSPPLTPKVSTFPL